MSQKHQCVLPHALHTPGTTKLTGKRLILASNSPRRKEILNTLGLDPDIVPSTFKEDLPHSSFDNVYEYPVATATEKAIEVYSRLVQEHPDDPPDLVIAGESKLSINFPYLSLSTRFEADTVVLSHHTSASSTNDPASSQSRPHILEKPQTKIDNLRMLLDLNGGACEVVTGVTLVFPIVTAPGFDVRSIDERTIVHFADNSIPVLEAYCDAGEGLDRAGGFAIQGVGGILIRKVDGDYWNVVGFPGASFFKFLDKLVAEEDEFLDI